MKSIQRDDYSLTEYDEQNFLDLLNAAAEGRLKIKRIPWKGNPVYLVDRYLFCVFDDCGAWDYISWVARDQCVSRFNQLPRSITDWEPSETALRKIFKWDSDDWIEQSNNP